MSAQEPGHGQEVPNGDLDAIEEARSVLMQIEWNEPWKRPFLAALSRIPNISAAARVAGVNRQYTYEAQAADPDFARAVKEAREVACDLLEQILHRRATVGEPVRTIRTRTKRDAAGSVVETDTTVTETQEVDTYALVQMLKAHRPQIYRERYDVRHHRGDETSLPAPVLDEVFRQPTRERMIELARFALQLELGEAQGLDVIDGNGHIVGPNGDA